MHASNANKSYTPYIAINRKNAQPPIITLSQTQTILHTTLEATQQTPMSERNHKRENLRYFGKPGHRTPLQELHAKQKSARNAARRIMKRLGRNIDGKDVDHIDHNPLNNHPSNLRVRSVSANRADNGHRTKKKQKKK